jgi:predicted DNA-binding transcriptional regulator YafY
MNIEKLESLHNLIVSGRARNTKAIARSLNVSDRMVYNYLNYMRNELNAPLVFDKNSGGYRYTEQGELSFKWNTKNK